MEPTQHPSPSSASDATTVERTSPREVSVTRMFDHPSHRVFDAWSRPDVFRRWWAPKSMGLAIRMCEMDVRVGGTYQIAFENHDMVFHGTYVAVIPNACIAWTNEEAGDAGSITTVTFEAVGDRTRLVFKETYPSEDALETAGTGGTDMMRETFTQLDELLAGTGLTP
jgi:uncharacterized protein YndB with AHSA1/START domain